MKESVTVGKFAGMARTAIQMQEAAKEEAKRRADEGECQRNDARKIERELLEDNVFPSLREASKDFQNENIPSQIGSGDSVLYPLATFVIGHDRAGRTGQRIAKFVAQVEEGLIKITVESGNGPRREFSARPGEIPIIEDAIADALNRWTEQGYPIRPR